jgi:hypothetical protein
VLIDQQSDDVEPRRSIRLWTGIGAAALAISAGAAYLHFGSQGEGRVARTPSAVAPAAPKPQPVTLYAATNVRLRDRPSLFESNIVGRQQRGDAVSGIVTNGTAGEESWIDLGRGRGFINLVNLRVSPPPKLQQRFGEKRIKLPGKASLLDEPGVNGSVLARLPQGRAVNLAGITDNGYLEILLEQGGTGYIADGAGIIAATQLPDLPPAIIVKIDGNGCATGPEIDTMFRRITARQATNLRAVEEAKYADDDARDAAIARFRARTEGKSTIIPLNRSFRGLKVTGLGVHPESQSVYFADPPEKVRQVFRSAGYRVGRDGKLPSREIYASIDTGNAKVGQTDMGCGV